MAAKKKAATKKRAAPKTKAKATEAKATEAKATAKRLPKPKASTRKSLEEMSQSHREHIQKWDPHLENLKAVFVWVAVARISGRKVTGPHYVAIKRGSKDYAIVSYDTEKQIKVTPKLVLVDGFETSAAMMEAFKEYRTKARAERAASKTPKATKPPKRTTKPKAPRATSTKKKAAKKPARRKAATKK